MTAIRTSPDRTSKLTPGDHPIRYRTIGRVRLSIVRMKLRVLWVDSRLSQLERVLFRQQERCGRWEEIVDQ